MNRRVRAEHDCPRDVGVREHRNPSGEKAAERLGESATVLKEVMEAPDKGIPEDLLSRRTAW